MAGRARTPVAPKSAVVESNVDLGMLRNEALAYKDHPLRGFFLAEQLYNTANALMEQLTPAEDNDLEKSKHTALTCAGLAQRISLWIDEQVYGLNNLEA